MTMNLPKVALSTLVCSVAFAIWGSAEAGDPDPNALPGIGEVAPAFGLRPFQAGLASPEGDEGRSSIELDSLCGMRRPAGTAVVLVTFINREGMSDLLVANSWHRRYGRAGLEILAISQEERPESFGADIVRARVGFPVLDDRHHVVATRYGIQGAPFSLLLDRECRVLGLSNQTLRSEQNSLGAAIAQLVDKAKQERKAARKRGRR
jgi:hypothetical protein